eukprot:scaffold5113_cov296-Prasinococcus_capsulatus_cf.AAC.1
MPRPPSAAAGGGGARFCRPLPQRGPIASQQHAPGLAPGACRPPLDRGRAPSLPSDAMHGPHSASSSAAEAAARARVAVVRRAGSDRARGAE